MTATLLDSATSERLVAARRTLTFSHPVVPTSPAAVDTTEWVTVYVLAALEDGRPPAGAVGSIAPALSRGESGQWLMRHDDGAWRATSAALVNPAPEQGKHYAIFDDEGEAMVVRYDDDEHTGNRNIAYRPFSIVSGRNGATWEFPVDAYGEDTLANTTYVEVEGPEVPAAEAAEVPEVAEETAGRPAVVSAEDLAHLGGKAHVEEDGAVLLNPEVRPGEAYLLWNRGTSTDNRVLILALGSGVESDPVMPLGYYTTAGDFRTGVHSSLPSTDERAWAKAKTEPAPVPEDAGDAAAVRLSGLQTTLSREQQTWDEMDEALASLAKEKEWCSEYESTVVPLGLSPRETKRDWRVRVTVRIEASIDSPDSAVDSRVSSYYDLPGLSMTSMSLAGSVEVDLYFSDTTEEGARDMVDSEEIIERMDSSADVTVLDWEIEGVYED